jgi:hypothetical protein
MQKMVARIVDAYARLNESTMAGVWHDVSVRAHASISR